MTLQAQIRALQGRLEASQDDANSERAHHAAMAAERDKLRLALMEAQANERQAQREAARLEQQARKYYEEKGEAKEEVRRAKVEAAKAIAAAPASKKPPKPAPLAPPAPGESIEELHRQLNHWLAEEKRLDAEQKSLKGSLAAGKVSRQAHNRELKKLFAESTQAETQRNACHQKIAALQAS